MDLSATSDAKEVAILRISELLKHPADLDTKVEGLRKKFTKQKGSIDASLKSGARSIFQGTREGLDLLAASKDQINTIRDEMSTIDRICSEAERMIDNYPRIKKISRTHANFVATEIMVTKFQDLYRRIDRLKVLLDEDKKNMLGPADAMLYIHYQLYKLEEFRDSTMHQAKDSSQDVIVTLKKYFQKLDNLSEEFTAYLWELARRTLKLVRAEQGSTVVRLLKIIECEEKADEKALAAEQLRKSNPNLSTAVGKWMIAEGSPRVVKSYRSKFFDVLHDSIQDYFAKMFAPFEQHLPQALDNTDFVFRDLTLVYDELVPRFPKKYKIFPFYVLEYHRHLYGLLNRIVDGELDAGTILRTLTWVRDYYAMMHTQLGVTEELLEPQLLDGRQDRLVAEYLRLLRVKLNEWMANLLKTETAEFVRRENPPEADSNGIYGTQAAVILFQMVNQQIDLASETSRGKLLMDVISECIACLRDAQKKWTDLLESEFRKQVERPQESAGGLVDYVIAVANDHMRCGDFTEGIARRMDRVIEDAYKPRMNEALNGCVEGFMKVAKHAYQILIDIAFHDVRGVFAQLFTPAWYDGDLISLIILTLNDYLTDYQQHLQEYLLSKLTGDLLDKFLASYVEAMRNKGAKFRMSAALDRITADMEMAVEFFSRYKSAKRVEKAFDVVYKLQTLLGSSKKMVFLDYYSLKKAYNDVPLAFVEDILSKRDDMDRASLKEAMELIRAKAKEEPSDPVAQPSIFSRIMS